MKQKISLDSELMNYLELIDTLLELCLTSRKEEFERRRLVKVFMWLGPPVVT